MTKHPYDAVIEFHRLKMLAAESRTLVIRSQIAMGVTLCRIAETELMFGHLDGVHPLLEKVKRGAENVRHHLAEPRHVLPDDLEKARNELRELDLRIAAVEASLPPRPPPDS